MDGVERSRFRASGVDFSEFGGCWCQKTLLYLCSQGTWSCGGVEPSLSLWLISFVTVACHLTCGSAASSARLGLMMPSLQGFYVK